MNVAARRFAQVIEDLLPTMRLFPALVWLGDFLSSSSTLHVIRISVLLGTVD
jgi:hypothetical protein